MPSVGTTLYAKASHAPGGGYYHFRSQSVMRATDLHLFNHPFKQCVLV